MKLICLIENTAVDDKLYAENGMSLFVEFGGKNYLIDAGLTGKAMENARRMKLPVDALDAVVITHNHMEHIGGIDAAMRLSPDAEIYLRAGAQTERFRKSGLFKEPAGMGKSFFKKYAEKRFRPQRLMQDSLRGPLRQPIRTCTACPCQTKPDMQPTD